MKRLLVVCTLVTLTSTSFYAQNALAQSRTAYYLQVNGIRGPQNSSDDLQHNEQQIYVNSMANLTKLRDKLAEAWQTLGMSPQAAQAVANAYQPNLAQNSHHASLRGKSGQEIASMLQSALAKKDYALADQMLIEYEQIEAKLGANVSPDSQH
jgi:hypothetical protein